MMFSAMTTAGAAKVEQVTLPPSMLKDKYPIMECLPDDAEGSLTLCAEVDNLSKPIAGKKHALKKYNQSALNTSYFLKCCFKY